jgi:hypothetical protein
MDEKQLSKIIVDYSMLRESLRNALLKAAFS